MNTSHDISHIDSFCILSLNVCGLKSKFDYPEFGELISDYDCLCFQESKCDDVDDEVLSNFFDAMGFICYTKHRTSHMLTRVRSGGLVLCIKKKWGDNVVYHNTHSKLVMWLSVKFNTNQNILQGNVYIPPSGSPYAHADCFNEIDSELDNLMHNEKVNVCMCGDFNARTGGKSEFLKLNNLVQDDFITDPMLYDKLREEYDLIERGIAESRTSCDKTINEYGNQLIELCQSNALYICNGRIGNYSIHGRTTSKDTSIVDYMIGSPAVLRNITMFDILPFDHLFSDIHCALTAHIEIKSHTGEWRL